MQPRKIVLSSLVFVLESIPPALVCNTKKAVVLGEGEASREPLRSQSVIENADKMKFELETQSEMLHWYVRSGFGIIECC